MQTQDTVFTRNVQKTFNAGHLIQNATENEAIKKRTKIKTNTEKNQDRKKKKKNFPIINRERERPYDTTYMWNLRK